MLQLYELLVQYATVNCMYMFVEGSVVQKQHILNACDKRESCAIF
jgi:hypothetical protein